MASVVKWFTSLVFNHLTLISVMMGSNPAYENMLDFLMACVLFETLAVERDVKPKLLPLFLAMT